MEIFGRFPFKKHRDELDAHEDPDRGYFHYTEEELANMRRAAKDPAAVIERAKQREREANARLELTEREKRERREEGAAA